jgi:hypothetical protein
MELLFGRCYFFLLGIDDQIIVFGQYRNERVLLLLNTPGELLQKAEKFMLVDCISFG